MAARWFGARWGGRHGSSLRSPFKNLRGWLKCRPSPDRPHRPSAAVDCLPAPLGRRQVVRQWILIPPCGGSNPPAPAIQRGADRSRVETGPGWRAPIARSATGRRCRISRRRPRQHEHSRRKIPSVQGGSLVKPSDHPLQADFDAPDRGEDAVAENRQIVIAHKVGLNTKADRHLGFGLLPRNHGAD